MKKLSIVYIIPRFHPFRGGAEQNIEAFAVRMAEKGHDVTVFTTNVRFRSEKLPWVENYKNITIRRFWAPNEWLYAGFYPGLLFALIRKKSDLIHVSGFGFIWVEICLVIKKLLDRKTIIINTPHGPFMATAKNGIKFIIKKIYTKILKLILPFLYTKVIAVVPKQTEWINNEYNIPIDRITVVPNGISEDYLVKKAPVHDKDEKVVITYLNRMEKYKGIQDVLYAMTLLDKKVLDRCEFWIMGREGSYTKKLRSIVTENGLEDYVRFIFTPTDEERDNAFLKSQINILPSQWEATGIVLLEAMAKGNVIVTTNQNQGVDLLINKKSGFAYDYGDRKKLAGILSVLIKDYETRREIIEHNVSFAKNFTWESIFPKYEALIEDLVSPH
jgi:glycosyltransferase involved in cell wall biosynthesis